MDVPNKELLKKCGKDEESYQKLKKYVEQLCSEKQQAEQSVDLLERAIKHDYDAIVITELNYEKPGPKIVYVNKGFCNMTGYSKEEVIGKTPRILQGPKTDRAVLDRLKKRLKEGQSFFGQAVNYKKDGSEFVNQWDIHPLTNDDGEITHWVSYQHDITERKRAEKTLVDTNIDFDKLVEESKRTLIDVDEQANIVMANKSFRDLIGYDKEELKRMKVWDLLPRSFGKSLKKRFKTVAEEDFDNESYRIIARHKSGAPLQLEVHTKLLKLHDQLIVRGDVKNITLQKKVLRKLENHNINFTKVFSQQSDFRYCVSLNDDGALPAIDYLSESFAALTGFATEHFENSKTWRELIHPEDADKVLRHFQIVWQQGKSHTEEYRIKQRSGGYLPVLDYAKPEYDPEDEETVICVKGAVTVDKSHLAPNRT